MTQRLTDAWALITGLAAICLGYVLLGRGDITVAPLLLVGGYCVLVPLYLLQAFLRHGGE